MILEAIKNRKGGGGEYVPSPLDVLESERVARSALFRLQHDRLLRETPTIGYGDGRERWERKRLAPTLRDYVALVEPDVSAGEEA